MQYELNENEAALIARARQTPEERAADNAKRQAEQETVRLARMTPEEQDAYKARKVAIEKMTVPQRMAEQFLQMKKTAETQLARPEIAAEVAAVTDALDVKE
jgi:hypothetical protein